MSIPLIQRKHIVLLAAIVIASTTHVYATWQTATKMVHSVRSGFADMSSDIRTRFVKEDSTLRKTAIVCSLVAAPIAYKAVQCALTSSCPEKALYFLLVSSASGVVFTGTILHNMITKAPAATSSSQSADV